MASIALSHDEGKLMSLACGMNEKQPQQDINSGSQKQASPDR